MKKPGRLQKRRKLFAWGIALLLLLVGLDYVAYPYGMAPGGRSGNVGQNGLWLRYTWYFGQHSDAETRQLAQQLCSRQIAFAYFHVRGVRADGTLKFHRQSQSVRLVDQLHRSAPHVRLIAWIYAGNADGRGAVDLSSRAVRQSMTQEARWLVTACHFDGVQWDYEICRDGDENFLALLRQTRMTLPPAKMLSVAAPLWLPGPLVRWGWSAAYYTRVAAVCDQVAVMGYDSGVFLPRAYVWLMEQQTVQVTQAAAKGSARCRVLIGVPTYGRGGLSHDAHAENIAMALRGVRLGQADSHENPKVLAGVAIFANYTTQPGEWRIYDRWWLKK